MSADQPTRLEQDPIARAIFECRFEPTSSGTADLLPGIFYQALSPLFNRVEALPASNVPVEVRRQMSPAYQYEAVRRLVGESINLDIAERSFGVEVIRKYPGWESFSDTIFKILTVAFTSPLVGAIERVSLRYQNIFNGFPNDFSTVDLELKLGEYKVSTRGFNVRAEIDDGNCTSVVQFSTGANAQMVVAGSIVHLAGPMLDIDTMYHQPPNFRESYRAIVNEIHSAEKSVFYGVTRKATIDQLGPVRGDKDV